MPAIEYVLYLGMVILCNVINALLLIITHYIFVILGSGLTLIQP